MPPPPQVPSSPAMSYAPPVVASLTSFEYQPETRVDVRIVKPAGAHFDQHLARSRNRRGPVGMEFQLVQSAVTGEHNGVHGFGDGHVRTPAADVGGFP